jgi:TFIIF-interacting CTD phosphatase-like protein
MKPGPLTERERYRLLPSKVKETPRHTLVLDIDETLVSSNLGESFSYTVLRPHLIPFLREVTELFELVYWTAGTESYGQAVINAIEEAGMEVDGKPVAGKVAALFRHDTLENLNYMKFLGHLNREVHNTLLIDDNQRSFPLTPRQAVTCQPFQFTDAFPLKDELGQLLRRKGKPIHFKSLNIAIPLPPKISEDDELLQLLPMLRAVASSPHAAKELDHWRPEGYERCDNIGQDYYKSGVGSWLKERRPKPIPPLGKSFAESYNKIHPSLLKILGPPSVYE